MIHHMRTTAFSSRRMLHHMRTTAFSSDQYWHVMHIGQDERESGINMEDLALVAEVDMVEIQCSQD